MALTYSDIDRLCRVPTNGRVRLKDYDPAWAGGERLSGVSKDVLKARAERFLEGNLEALTTAQELLWATDRHSVLVVLQAMDAAGKDGAIKHVMSGINPQGCQIVSFKRPSDEELDHTFLWRYMRAVPERGRIGIFNRSYYEDVLVVRVHPELLERQKLPAPARGRRLWDQRFDDINRFERHLTRNGTLVLKFFLHVSKEEQRRRLLKRLATPAKRWKFSDADVDERDHWNAYQKAFEQAFRHTSSTWAPWWIIPADHKWVARALIAAILTQRIRDLELRMPAVSAARERELAAIGRRLRR